MSSESKPRWWSRLNTNHAVFASILFVALFSLLIRLLQLNEIFVVIFLILIAVAIMLATAIVIRKQIGKSIWLFYWCSAFAFCVKIFDGAFLDCFWRFFIDCTVYFAVGMYILWRSKGHLSFAQVFLLLFAPPIVLFIPFGFNFGSKIFFPLDFTSLLVLLFLYAYSKSRKTLVVSLSALFVFTFLSFVAYPSYFSSLMGKQFSSKAVADERTLLPLLQENGDTLRIAQLNNKIVILDTWYTGCGVCYKKFPEFEALSKQYASDTNLYFATINMPLTEELNNNLAFEAIKEYQFRKLKSTEDIQKKLWKIEGYPTLLVFDKQKRLRYQGTLMTDKTLLVNNIHKIIEKLKKEQ